MLESGPDKLALRIDDIGASSKHHLYYTKRWYTNWGPLRDRRLLGHWAPYREMGPNDWLSLYKVLEKYGSKLTVGVTACWVEDDGTLVPFPDKFPNEAEALGEGVSKGLVEIANHGLTHCVLKDQKYRRRAFFGTNRPYHREFWEWVPAAEQRSHLTRAQTILTEYFRTPITTLVPPGNVYSRATLQICKEIGLRTINCERPSLASSESPKVIGDDQVLPFHDREIVEMGVGWLERKLQSFRVPPQLFIRDL